MKVYGLLLDRHVGGIERRHDGRIAVDQRNRRWCSDGFEIGCDNGEKVRVAFALDCCDREAMSFLATTGGIRGEDVRDLMVTAVEHRFGRINRLPVTIEWLSDNGSCYIAGDTRSFARDIGLEPRTTPIESPQSNGMAEAFVRMPPMATTGAAGTILYYQGPYGRRLLGLNVGDWSMLLIGLAR